MRRRATSDYCTDKCARDQQRDDDASQASEREALAGWRHITRIASVDPATLEGE